MKLHPIQGLFRCSCEIFPLSNNEIYGVVYKELNSSTIDWFFPVGGCGPANTAIETRFLLGHPVQQNETNITCITCMQLSLFNTMQNIRLSTVTSKQHKTKRFIVLFERYSSRILKGNYVVKQSKVLLRLSFFLRLYYIVYGISNRMKKFFKLISQRHQLIMSPIFSMQSST